MIRALTGTQQDQLARYIGGERPASGGIMPTPCSLAPWQDSQATTRFRSREHLQTTLERYEKHYNDHLPQRALDQKTQLQAIRTWQTEQPELFNYKTKNQAGLDS